MAPRKSPAAKKPSKPHTTTRAKKPQAKGKPTAKKPPRTRPDSRKPPIDPAFAIKPPASRPRPERIKGPWTQEKIAEVANLLWAYIEATPCPTIPEFCYLNLVERRRLYEFEDLVELKDILIAKRAVYYERRGQALCKEDGPLGAFVGKALSNVGSFSWSEKTEVEHSGSIGSGVLKVPAKLETKEWAAAAVAQQEALKRDVEGHE